VLRIHDFVPLTSQLEFGAVELTISFD
jgi:hypothetical protein